MRGFTVPAFQTITFTRGAERISFKVYARPLLFDTLLSAAYPAPEGDGPETGPYWENIVVLHTAASLRDEGLPPMPGWDAGVEAWEAHAAALTRIYQEAGLTNGQLAQLNIASRELTVSKNLDAALEAAGNA